jgi:hypothetical protein
MGDTEQPESILRRWGKFVDAAPRDRKYLRHGIGNIRRRVHSAARVGID